LSTKLHAAGDASGNPVPLMGSPGQRNESFAHELLEGFAADVTIADNATTPIISAIGSRKPAAKSSFRRNATARSSGHDAEFYKKQNIIERFFYKLKQFPLVATRYGKLRLNSWAFLNSPLSPSGSYRQMLTAA
jgi:putative transposase